MRREEFEKTNKQKNKKPKNLISAKKKKKERKKTDFTPIPYMPLPWQIEMNILYYKCIFLINNNSVTRPTLVASAFLRNISSIFTAKFLTTFIPSISSTLTDFSNSLYFWK